MAKEKEKPQKEEKSGNKWFLIGGVLLVLLIVGGGAGAWFLGVFDDSKSPEVPAGSDGIEPRNFGPLVEMEEFVVNIMHKDEARFLKVGIALEMKSADSGEALKKRMPQIKDGVLLLLSNKRFDDIKDLQGKLQLKSDLLARINALAGQGEVLNLFFTDFVIQ